MRKSDPEPHSYAWVRKSKSKSCENHIQPCFLKHPVLLDAVKALTKRKPGSDRDPGVLSFGWFSFVALYTLVAE